MMSWLRKTLRAIWYKTALRFWYSIVKRELAIEFYCDRCDSCGYDKCCPAERCDNGIFCANYYGDKKTRLKIISERTSNE